jgi:sugar lactone lactonase YvrE
MSNLADLLPAGGGQNNTDFVADGNVSAGAPVILTAAGKAAAIAESSVTEAAGSATTFASVSVNGLAAAYDTANDKVVVFYSDADDAFGKGKVVIGTVSGTSISFGSPVTVTGNRAADQSVVFDPDSGNVVLFYQDTDNSYYGTAIVGTVSGTSISFGSAVVFSSSSNNYNSAVYDTSTDRVYNSYTDAGNSNHGTGVVGTVSGTSISFGTPVVFNAAASYPTSSAFDSNANKVVTAYYNAGDGYSKGIVGTVSGTSVSFGSPTTFHTGTGGFSFASVYDVNANKTLISFKDVNNSNYGSSIVGTVSGTSISFGTAAAFEDATTDQIKGCYDSNTNKVVIVYRDGGSSYYGTAVNATISGTSVTFTTPFQLIAGSTNPQQPVFDPDSNKVAFSFFNTGVGAGQGLIYTPPSTSTNLTSTNLLGIASGAISDTATGTINTWGSRNEAQTGLTIGSDYYVQTDGRIEAGVTSIAFDISSATYTQNFDISSQATIPQAIAFNPTGTKMFIVDIAGQDVNEYALSTGFDVSSASYTQNFSVASQDTAPTGISFNAAGTKMFVCGYTNDNVYEYTLSSGFNLSTASYAQALDVSGQDTLPKDVVFNTDGTKMFVLGGIGEDVNEYTLSAYDISTASFVDSFSVASQESAPDGIAFNTDGTKMFIVGNGDTVFQYNLSSGFDVSTASYASISFSVTSQETGPTGIAFSADGTKMFIVGTQGDDVNQYATTANSFSTTYLIGKAITATQINIKDYTG